MKVNIQKITGNWKDGYALDKHMLSSTFLGYDHNGNPRFNNTRSEAGEALYKLKYQLDWSQAPLIAEAIQTHILSILPKISLIIPVPASSNRIKQPVEEIAKELSKLHKIPLFSDIIMTNPAPHGTPQLKNLNTKEEKIDALAGRFTMNPAIQNNGCWNALILDDLFDTGATMEAVCSTLKPYSKIANIFAATVTRK